MAVQWDLNNAYLAAVVGQASMFYLKEAMKAAGWIVNGSSDGTANWVASGAKPTAATVDHITTPAKFVANGSWIVLEGPGGRQFLLGHKGSTNDRDWCIAYSRAAGFSLTTGALATYPTASDVGTVIGTLPGTLASMFSNNNAYTHIMVSDTTDSFYCLAAIQGTALVTGGLFCDVLAVSVAGDVDPAVVGSLYASGSDYFTSGYAYSVTTTTKGYIKNGAAYDFQPMGLGYISVGGAVVFPATGASGVGVNPHDSHTDELPADWARPSGAGAPYCYKGKSGMFRLVGNAITAADTLDSDGALSRIVYGTYRTSLPWDLATVPLV